MIGFLRGHPTIEELELSHVKYSDANDAATHIEPATLQHLKSAMLEGRPSSQSLPRIEVNLLPYLLLPSTGQCVIWICLEDAFQRGTNCLLTLIHAWEIVSGPGGGFGAGSGFTQVKLFIEEHPSTLTGQLELSVAGWGSLCVAPENTVLDSWSWLTPDWNTITTDEDPGADVAGDDEFQAQLSRLGCYLDPFRWSPSPLATVEDLILSGFGYTTNKGKYLQYLRECFRGLNQVRELHVEKTNPGMVVHLLQPFEGESGEMVLFPLLWCLAFYNCTSMELPRTRVIEVMEKRAAFGSVLEEVWVDGELVDLPEVSDIQDRT